MTEYFVGDFVRVVRSGSGKVPVGNILEVVDYLNDEVWIDAEKVELGELSTIGCQWEFERVATSLVETPPSVGNRKYQREIKPGVWVDVYDVLYAFTVSDPCLQHLIKKALAAGQRGHKDTRQDLVDIRDSAQRAVDEFDVWGGK